MLYKLSQINNATVLITWFGNSSYTIACCKFTLVAEAELLNNLAENDNKFTKMRTHNNLRRLFLLAIQGTKIR